MKSNYSFYLLVFMVTTFFGLIGISFINLPLISSDLKSVDFLSSIKIDDQYKNDKANNFIDSHSKIIKEQISDSKFEQLSIINYESESNYGITKFIDAIKDLIEGKRKKVRIGYFGDSIIEGDLISQDLRNLLQKKFGGTGVGFVPITSIVSQYRTSILHSYSDNWVDLNFKNSSNLSFFLSGHTFESGVNSNVTYHPAKNFGENKFQSVFLYYNKQESYPKYILVNNKNVYLKGDETFNVCLADTNCSSIKASFTNAKNIYGFSFESNSGVFVDNFAFRGISGIELEKIPLSHLSNIAKNIDYSLIILQYGPNLLYKPNLTDFRWYTPIMASIVNKLKKAFPNSSVLIVSTGDKSFRYNGFYETGKGVLPLIEQQNIIAKSTKSNFWNLYNVMGGYNSMLNWVNTKPSLARKDYTHFNALGAGKIGNLIYQNILAEYNKAKHK